MVNATSIGNKIRSSKYPIIGIKSGIKSIGERAYTTIKQANIFASIGVSESFKAKNNAGISSFSFSALSFKFIVYSSFNKCEYNIFVY